MKYIFILITFSTCFYSCKRAELYCNDRPYTYDEDVKNVIDKNCNVAGCHSQGSDNGDFTKFEELEIFVQNGKLFNRIFVAEDMPPRGRVLSFKSRKILQCWMENSFIEN